MAGVLSSLKRKIKSIRLVFVGRFVVLALFLTQCGFFAAYPTWYTDDLRWIAVIILYVPAILYWGYCLKTDAELIRMFFTWGLYVLVALVPNIAITFGVCGDELDKENFLGPNCLKVILCLTPVLFLVLLNTADDLSDNEEYRQLAKELSVHISIDLFDGVEMLDVVLDERENNYGIKKGFGIAMITVACFSFVLSLLQMAENKLENGSCELDKKLAIIRNGIQMVFVNLVFLIIRLVIFIKYKKDESIFIAKNGIAIFLSSLEIYYYRQS
ncbi:uncharacterized protein LOC110041159 [Orbicella faveolata]|uniref:uncharacterized protein LOC110041159 n=1 Tax=Orbicella faveolata TaxID=48498 RepID=UPI0009E35803|nr:uncharacterized protein LOC110041159 [Orbicella faveolata]